MFKDLRLKSALNQASLPASLEFYAIGGRLLEISGPAAGEDLSTGRIAMAHKFPEYEPFFHKGLRIEIGIPQADGDVFRDWAIVKEYREDTILVQLSRDYLPMNVRVDVSTILDANVWIKQEVYTCPCIVTERQSDRVLRIRLFGLLTLKERRHFFRLEANFRFRFTEPDKRIREEVETEWQKRRELESMKFGGYDEIVIAARQAEFHALRQELVWHESLDNPAVLSGGGIGFKLEKRLAPETLLHMELHLPLSPPRVVHAVAEVVYSLEPRREVERGEAAYRTGMHFILMEERDRDHIFRYISMLQLIRLREISENRPFKYPYEGSLAAKRGVDGKTILRRALYTVIFLILLFFIGRFLIDYRDKGNPNEIKAIYERAIKQYRKER